MAQTSAPRGRPRGFCRDDALDTALRLFWDRGYEQISIADLTEAIGVNRPSFYAAFTDKPTLYAEALARYAGGFYGAGKVAAALTDIDDPREAIRTFFARQAKTFVNTPVPGCMVIRNRTDCRNADIAAKLNEQTANVKKLLRKRLKQIDLPAGDTVEQWVDHTYGLLVSMTAAARDGASEARLKKMAELGLRPLIG
ncbi:MAG: TetR/AcrR family transcriptional regulator [Planctomycetota bacterium]